MTTTQIRRLVLLLVVATCRPPTTAVAAGPPPAASPAAETKAEAKARFDRGLQLFEESDNAGALSEFKRAYELIPNQVVLFNMGLVYATMRRPVEAVQALEKVLADSTGLSPAMVARAQEIRADQERRIGLVNVATSTPAAIEIDGVEVATTPLDKPIAVAQGTHVVAAVATGYLPKRREITIAGGARQDVIFELQPAEARMAQLEVASAMPGVQIFVDGEAVGTTPFSASLTVAPGTRLVEARRPGYRDETQRLTLGEGASGTATIRLEEDLAATSARGRLELVIDHSPASVTIDGRSRGVYRGPIDLPGGPHLVRVDREGFESSERLLDVQAGGLTTARFSLPPTAKTLAEQRSRTASRRTWGFISLVGGGVLAGAGVLVAKLGTEQKEDADDELAVNFTPGAGGSCDPTATETSEQIRMCEGQRAELDEDRKDAKLLRTAGYVGLGVGLAAAITGTVLLLTGDAALESAANQALAVNGWWLPGGGGVLVSAGF